MTFDDYTLAVEQALDAHPNWRLGQAAFNVLWEHRPDLSEQIRGTKGDPFHNSNEVPAFYAWVKRNWETGTAEKGSNHE